MSKLDDSLSKIAGLVIAVVLFIAVAYGAIAFCVAWATVQGKVAWCEYENGLIYGKDSKQTGRRWNPDVLTVGLTGQCINPGDKGL